MTTGRKRAASPAFETTSNITTTINTRNNTTTTTTISIASQKASLDSISLKKPKMSHKAANPTPASSSKSSPPTLLDSPVAIDHKSHKPVGSRSQPIELSEEEEKENYFEEDEEVESYDQYSDDDVNDFDDDFDDFDEDASMGVEEEEEDDDYYEFLDKLKKPKIYETEFEVLSPKDLHKMEKDTIAHVSGFLSVTEAQARALLWTYKWQADPLIEAYVDNRTKILEKSGLLVDETTGNPISIAPYSVSTASPGYLCFICCEEAVADKPFYTFEIDCRHSLCVDCYKNYLRGKIVENGESRQIRCPQFPCKLQIPEEAVEYLFVGDGATKTNNNNDNSHETSKKPKESNARVFEKYQNLLDKDFVTLMDKTTFCPAPDCDKIIKCTKPLEDPNRKVPGVKCTCGKEFCFACSLDDHMPATCKIAKAWLKKCQDDSETANWISANTKECAKCHSTIEKSGGCNHMTCQKCKHEFCWICMGDWSLHGTSYYNCSRYDEADSMAARSEQDKSRSQLKRYLHYYNRYMNHLDSLKRDSETFEQMQEKMKELQESAGMSWIEVQFLSQAFEVLSASRHTMTWTYAFAYYLQKTHRTVIFEDNQNDLEVAVEQLSELFERPAMDLALLKINLLDKCQYVASRRVVLLEDVAQGLLDDAWKYNVSF